MEQSGAVIRLGFLGADEATPALVRAALASRRFEVAGVCECGESGEVASLLGRLRPLAVWEQLLDDQRFDAVVVAHGADQDLRAEQMRKFLQTEMPVLASHPVVDSMLVYYELDMIRRETQAVAVPELAMREHPAIHALAELVALGDGSPIGKVEQLTFERSMAESTKRDVERQFARDVDLVRAIAGEMTRLGAMAAASETPTHAGLGVQMSGTAGIAARWSVVPRHGGAEARLTLAGSRGRAVLDIASADAPWTLEVVAGGESHRQQFEAWDAAGAALDGLAGAIAGETSGANWVDACRSVELAETIERSLNKSRTIELYYEDYTEEGTFKGTMTSLGCGLLLAAVFVLGLVGLAEQVNMPFVKYWPYVLLALLAVFLCMQLVMLTSGKKEPDADVAGDRPGT